jgi:hypothetical protein
MYLTTVSGVKVSPTIPRIPEMLTINAIKIPIILAIIYAERQGDARSR